MLDINVLLEPVVNEAREAAVQVAREEAQSSAIATVTEELTAQQAGSVDGIIHVHLHVHVQCMYVHVYMCLLQSCTRVNIFIKM